MKVVGLFHWVFQDQASLQPEPKMKHKQYKQRLIPRDFTFKLILISGPRQSDDAIKYISFARHLDAFNLTNLYICIQIIEN